VRVRDLEEKCARQETMIEALSSREGEEFLPWLQLFNSSANEIRLIRMLQTTSGLVSYERISTRFGSEHEEMSYDASRTLIRRARKQCRRFEVDFITRPKLGLEMPLNFRKKLGALIKERPWERGDARADN